MKKRQDNRRNKAKAEVRPEKEILDLTTAELIV